MWDGLFCEVIPLAPPGSSGGLTLCVLWSGSSPVSARQWGRLVRLSPASTQDPEASTEWRLVTTPEVPVISLYQSAKQSRSVREWGMVVQRRRLMTKLGFVWILIYRACGSGQCPGLPVYSCQLGSPGHLLLATLAMPGQGWVPAAACQMWQTCSSTKHRS